MYALGFFKRLWLHLKLRNYGTQVAVGMARAVLAKHLCLELERVRLVSLGALLEDPLSCYGICHLNPKNNFQSIEYHHAALVDLRDAGMLQIHICQDGDSFVMEDSCS